MKERLIGDDQLLVTADTTMGDPLWDWVAADAARRAPDGWRIANIGAVSTGAAAPRTRPTATRRRRPASRSGSCTAGEPASAQRRDPDPTARPTPRPPSDRTRVRRLPKRGRYDRATIDAILDEAIVGHVGVDPDGQPYATPTDVWRQGDRLYWHGSAASRMLRATDGQPVCVTVTHLDGLVLARSGFNHSVNYRSVMVLGTAHLVTDEAEVDAALEAFIEHLYPGRWATLRPMTAQGAQGDVRHVDGPRRGVGQGPRRRQPRRRGRRDLAGLGRGHPGADGPRRARAGRARPRRDGRRRRSGCPSARPWTARVQRRSTSHGAGAAGDRDQRDEERPERADPSAPPIPRAPPRSHRPHRPPGRRGRPRSRTSPSIRRPRRSPGRGSAASIVVRPARSTAAAASRQRRLDRRRVGARARRRPAPWTRRPTGTRPAPRRPGRPRSAAAAAGRPRSGTARGSGRP